MMVTLQMMIIERRRGWRRVMMMQVMTVMMTMMMISQGSEGGRDCMTELSLEALAEDHMLLFANHHHQ